MFNEYTRFLWKSLNPQMTSMFSNSRSSSPYNELLTISILCVPTDCRHVNTILAVGFLQLLGSCKVNQVYVDEH